MRASPRSHFAFFPPHLRLLTSSLRCAQVCGLACHPREAAMLSCATDGLVKAWAAPPPGQRGEED